MVITVKKATINLLERGFEKPFAFDVKVFISIVLFNIGFILSKLWLLDKPLVEESDYAMLTLNGVFVLLVLAPVIEEFVFRGVFSFGKNRFWSMVYIPVVVFVGITLFKLPLGTNMIVVLSLLVGMSSFFFYSSIKSFIRMNSLLMIALMALLFSVAHIHNYETWDLNSYLGLLPRLIGGLFFGYAAVKYSLWAAMGFHFGNNLLVVVIAFIQRMVFDFSDQGL